MSKKERNTYVRDENTYIKLYRKIETNKLLSKDNDAFNMFVKILLSCNRKDGCLEAGRKQLGELCNIAPKRAYNKLKLLEKHGFITVKSTTHYSKIYVNNWSKYQENIRPTSDQHQTTKNDKSDNQELLLNNAKVDNQEQQIRPTSDQHQTLNNNKELINIDIDKSISSTKIKKEKIWKYDENDKRLAILLFDLIHDNGHFTEKNLQDKNIDVIRLMRTQDKRKPEEIEYIIVWSQQDSFWSGVILSTEGVRRNFNKMATQIMRNNKSNRIVEI